MQLQGLSTRGVGNGIAGAALVLLAAAGRSIDIAELLWRLKVPCSCVAPWVLSHKPLVPLGPSC